MFYFSTKEHVPQPVGSVRSDDTYLHESSDIQWLQILEALEFFKLYLKWCKIWNQNVNVVFVTSDRTRSTLSFF